MCALRLAYASPYASSWDAVDFALALDRFDLLAMQPHFPGYPYFILAATLVRSFVGDAVAALSAVSAIAYASAVVPMYRLVRATLPAWPAALAVVAMQGSAFMWLIASQPMSEGMAVAALWWYLWSLHESLRSDRFFVRMAPALLFGLLMGIRVSYLPFGAGLLLLLQREWKRNGRLGPAALLMFIVSFQLLWIGALAATEGSITGFSRLSFEFIRGHFTEWGGAATADAGEPLPVRFVRLIAYNILWAGLCGGNAWNAAAMGAMLAASAAAMFVGRRTTAQQFNRLFRMKWLIILFVLYFLWALFAQNVDKPRHIVPLIGITLWLTACFVYAVSTGKRIIVRTTVITTGLLALILQLSAGLQLLLEQRNELPPTYQLHNHMERLGANFILYTWEETRVLHFLQADYSHRRIHTYSLFLQEIEARPDETVYITGAVADGFVSQGAEIEGHLVPVAEFSGNEMIEPVYHEIRLYEWKRQQ